MYFICVESETYSNVPSAQALKKNEGSIRFVEAEDTINTNPSKEEVQNTMIDPTIKQRSAFKQERRSALSHPSKTRKPKVTVGLM